MKLASLMDLYILELKDLYSAEKQLLRALPKVAKAATAEQLVDAVETHLEETETQVDRLEQIFKGLKAAPTGHKCEAMAGLVAEADEVLQADADPDVLDAALIAQCQRIEHYEIAGYGCARTYAQVLGREEDAELLQETLDEEGATDKKLSKLALRLINLKAADTTR